INLQFIGLIVGGSEYFFLIKQSNINSAAAGAVKMYDAIIFIYQGFLVDEVLEHTKIFNLTNTYQCGRGAGNIGANFSYNLGHVCKFCFIYFLGPVVLALGGSVVIKSQRVIFIVKKVFHIIKGHGIYLILFFTLGEGSGVAYKINSKEKVQNFHEMGEDFI